MTTTTRAAVLFVLTAIVVAATLDAASSGRWAVVPIGCGMAVFILVFGVIQLRRGQ